MSLSEQPWTVRRILEWTSAFFARKGVDSPRLSAELLMAHVLSVPRIKLYTDYERPLEERELTAMRGLVQRASEHEPIAYLTGKAHFFNLEFAAERGVLIPRPDTETLVEQVIHLCRQQAGFESPRILDLCTGGGCIAAALAKNIKSATLFATDISPVAAALARRNIEKLGLSERVTVLCGDLFQPLVGAADTQPMQVIVANPPYIPSAKIAELDRVVRDYEPLAALDGGPDGLSAHRRILAEAPGHLIAGGRVFLEIAFDQAEAALAMAGEHSAFMDVRIVKDYAGNDRVLTVRKA